MKRLFFLLIVSALGGGWLEAQQIIVMKDGDRISGHLLRIDKGKWVIKYAGVDVHLPADSVASLTSATALGLRLRDSTVLAASVAPTATGLKLSEDNGQSRIVTVADIAAVGPATDLGKLRLVSIGVFSPFFRFWGITVSLGATFEAGNSNSDNFTFFTHLNRRTTKDRLYLQFQASQQRQPISGGDSVTSASWLGQLRGDFYLRPWLFAALSTRQSQNTFQGLALQSFYLGGLGYQAIQSTNTSLSAQVGAGVRYEDLVSGMSTTDPVGVLSVTWHQTLGPLVFIVAQSLTPNLKDFSDYNFLGQASVTATLIAGLGLRLATTTQYDSTPQPGRENLDFQFTTTIAYSGGRKLTATN